MPTACLHSALSFVRTYSRALRARSNTTGGNPMKRKLLAVLITAMFVAPAVYAQSSTAPRDTGMTKDRPAATRSKDGSPDAVITSKIKTGFIRDKIVRSRNYNVDTSGGVVTVKGKAGSQAEADRAMEIAKNTQGVSSVKNEIQVIASADKPKRDGTSASSSTTKRDTRAAAGDPTPRNSTPPSEQPKDRTASTGTKAGGSASTTEGRTPDALITTKIKA